MGIRVRVVPRAGRDEVCDEADGAVKVRLRAPPVDGKANRALCALLAKRLGLRKRAVVIATGETSRYKQVVVHGLSEADVRARLGLAGG